MCICRWSNLATATTGTYPSVALRTAWSSWIELPLLVTWLPRPTQPLMANPAAPADVHPLRQSDKRRMPLQRRRASTLQRSMAIQAQDLMKLALPISVQLTHPPLCHLLLRRVLLQIQNKLNKQLQMTAMVVVPTALQPLRQAATSITE